MRILAVALIVSSVSLIAQSDPAFDVASIKPNTSLADGGGGGPSPGGRYWLTNMPVRALICGFSLNTGVLDGGGVTMETLMQILTPQAGRPVSNRTGLSGGYDILLKWTAALGADTPADAVSIFTALQEQLGLKLESSTAPLDVVVVDRIERPSEN